jgi:serralysin
MAEYSISPNDTNWFQTSIESVGDQDTFGVHLQAGFSYDFETLTSASGGYTLNDTTLTLYDPSGNQVASNDDGGVGLASYIDNFQASVTGVYTLTVADHGNNDTGSYAVTAWNWDHGNGNIA